MCKGLRDVRGHVANALMAHPDAPQSGTEETTLKVTPFLLTPGRSPEVRDHAKSIVELPVWIGIAISFEFRVSCAAEWSG